MCNRKSKTIINRKKHAHSCNYFQMYLRDWHSYKNALREIINISENGKTV